MEVRGCPHGLGLFAVRNLLAGYTIARFRGVRLTSDPASPPGRGRALRIGANEYWDEEPPESEFYWSNFIDHSRELNCRFVFEARKHSVSLRTTKAISAGQELFLKYDDYYPTNPTSF